MNKYKKPGKRGRISTAAVACALGLLLAALVLPGCAAVALSAVGPAAEFGIDHAFSGAAAKTYTAPLANLRLAALKSLSRMEMDVTKDEAGDDGEWEIEAEAGDRTVSIDLASLTPMTTRVRVVADRGGIFFKDSATAVEVVAQISRSMAGDNLYAEQQTAFSSTGDEQ